MNANICANPKTLNSNTHINGSKQEGEKNSLTDSSEVWLPQNYWLSVTCSETPLPHRRHGEQHSH